MIKDKMVSRDVQWISNEVNAKGITKHRMNDNLLDVKTAAYLVKRTQQQILQNNKSNSR